MPDISLIEKRMINKKLVLHGWWIPETDEEAGLLSGLFSKLSNKEKDDFLNEVQQLRARYRIPEGVVLYPLKEDGVSVHRRLLKEIVSKVIKE